jgi:hypothetical protein
VARYCINIYQSFAWQNQEVLLVQRFVQPVQVGVVVLFGEVAGLAVVAALHDVQRDCVYVYAGAAGHGRNMAKSCNNTFQPAQWQ